LLVDEIKNSLPFKVRRKGSWYCGCIRKESKVIPYRVPLKLVPSIRSGAAAGTLTIQPALKGMYMIFTACVGRGAPSAGAERGKRQVWKIMRKSRRHRGIVEGRYVMTNKTVARGEGKGVRDADGAD